MTWRHQTYYLILFSDLHCLVPSLPLPPSLLIASQISLVDSPVGFKEIHAARPGGLCDVLDGLCGTRTEEEGKRTIQVMSPTPSPSL